MTFLLPTRKIFFSEPCAHRTRFSVKYLLKEEDTEECLMTLNWKGVVPRRATCG